MRKTISLDTETPYGKGLTVVDDGYVKYARRPEMEPYMISVCDGEESWAGHPRDFNFDALVGHDLLSHNAAFDQEIILGGVERGLFTFPAEFVGPMQTIKNWHCTANMSAFLWNVRSLADACSIGLGVDISKGVRDRAKDKSWDDIVKEGWADDMLKYARDDAAYCWHLWNRHAHKWPTLERRLSQLTIDQGRRGVAIDVPALEEAINLLNRVILTAQDNLPWVKRGKKPGSPIGIAEECRLNNIPPPPVKAHDPEAAAEWEELYASRFPFVLALRNIRKAKKTLATLETIKYRLRPDGTVPFSLKYAGASTLRWAGDAGWNLQNQNREPLFIDSSFAFLLNKKEQRKNAKLFDDEQAGKAAVGKLSNGVTFVDMRGLIVARPGKMLCPVDLAQIEPRVLNKLAGNEVLLEKIREGMSIYEAFARDSLDWKGGELKTENKKLYSLAKADVLGLGYGCGWEKFITVALTMADVDITEGDEDFAKAAAVDGKIYTRWRVGLKNEPWQYDTDAAIAFKVPALSGVPGAGSEEKCVFVEVQTRRGPVVKPLPVYGMRSRVTVEQFRKTNPLIVKLWQDMDEALRASEGEDFVVTGPNGYTLTYRKVRREVRKKKDKETGETYEKTVFTAEVGGKRTQVYGGLLVENLVQWVARNVFAENVLELHDWLQAQDPEQWVLFSVHDEGVPEVNPTTDKREIERIMSRCPDWLEGCPIGAEAKMSPRYLK